MDNVINLSRSEGIEFKFQTWHLFLIAVALSILMSVVFQNLIMTKEVYYNLYSSQMEEHRIDDYISLIQKFQIWGYLVTPLYVWIRIAFVAFLLQLPFMFKYIEIPFKNFFRIVTIAYFVLLTTDIIRFIYLYYQPVEQLTLDSLTLIPLSLTNILNKSSYSDAAYSFLQKINLFELLWCFVVYLGIKKFNKIEKIDAALIVFGVWVGIVIITSALIIFINSFL